MDNIIEVSTDNIKNIKEYFNFYLRLQNMCNKKNNYFWTKFFNDKKIQSEIDDKTSAIQFNYDLKNKNFIKGEKDDYLKLIYSIR